MTDSFQSFVYFICSATFSVQFDTEGPVCPASWDISFNSDGTDCIAPGYNNVPDLENATGIEISDNCTPDADLIVTYRDSLIPTNCDSPTSTFFDTREVIRTYTFEDACGNINESCPQYITYNISGCQDLETYGRITVQGTSFFNVSGGCDVPAIQVSELETGVCGYVEYMWLVSTEEQPNGQPYIPNSLNIGTLWTIIPEETEPTLDPGIIIRNTYYVRCARNFSCCMFGESNVVGYRVTDDGTCPITSPVIVSDCDDNIDLRSPTDDLLSQDNWKYESNMNITGNNTVGAGAQLTLDAGISTVLMQGFQVDTSAALEVYTTGCNE